MSFDPLPVETSLRHLAEKSLLPWLVQTPAIFNICCHSLFGLERKLYENAELVRSEWITDHEDIYEWFDEKISQYGAKIPSNVQPSLMEEAMSQFNPIDVYIFVILAQVRVDRSLLDTATLSLNTKQFTIVSYNIHSDTNATAEVLQSIGADIIVVQEVHLASFELLQEELGSNFASFGGFTDNYGIGIFSKWPLRDVSLKRCSLSNRILQVSSVVLPLGEIKIGHTHLSPIGEELRMQELKEFGVSDAGLDILIGDFNSVRQSDYTASEWNCIAEDRSTNPQVVNFLLESFQDPWDDKELRGQDSLSYSSKQAKTRIDYAFVKAKEPRIQVEQIEYMDCDASDHYPLIVDFVQLKK